MLQVLGCAILGADRHDGMLMMFELKEKLFLIVVCALGALVAWRLQLVGWFDHFLQNNGSCTTRYMT